MIYQFTLDKVECTSYLLLCNCKQNITSLSILVGRTVGKWQVCLSLCFRSQSNFLAYLSHRLNVSYCDHMMSVSHHCSSVRPTSVNSFFTYLLNYLLNFTELHRNNHWSSPFKVAKRFPFHAEYFKNLLEAH